MVLSLRELRDGVTTSCRNCVAYDLDADEAHFEPASLSGRALLWELHANGDRPGDTVLAHDVELDPDAAWIMRCDRIDFPPGGVAYRHTHPGPGIRYLLRGSIEIATAGTRRAYGPGEAWFEEGPEPVHATAADDAETSFVRVMLLPSSWAGKRTIRYVDPADDERPKLQRATVYLDRELTLP